jgi:hypothetical protein
MGPTDWDARGAAAREGLEPLRFLVGRWQGEGSSDGVSVRASLEIAPRFGDTVLEARERLEDDDGALLHEDASFYRYDPVARQIKVLQIMAHAWVTDQLVQPEDWGCRWYNGPEMPRVELRPDGPDGLLEEVWEPEARQPSVRVRYRRV